MSDLDFRTIVPHERDAVLDLLAEWLNDRAFFARYFEHDVGYRDALCFVAADGKRIVSTLQVFRRRICVDGVEVQVGGIGNVFTTAAYREHGIASELLTRAVAAMDAHGFDLSLLFAVRLAFYGRLGWQSHVRHLVFVEGAPAHDDGPSALAPFVQRDLDAVMEIYDAYNTGRSGPTVRDRRYWLGQLHHAGNPHEDFLVARRGGEIVAYARGAPLYDVYVVMEHGHLPGHEDALVQLLCHLQTTAAAAFPGMVTQLAIAPDVQERLRRRGLTLRPVEDVFWMWRIISPERLAAKLGIDAASLDTEDVFHRLLPPERSVYWMADRF